MSREVRLTAVPAAGLPGPEHFELAEVPLPVPDEGQVLVRNWFFHVFAALRTLIGAGARATPVPPLRPGDTLHGPAIGEIVSAPGGSGLRAGDLVSHRLGWREYAVVPAGQVSPLGGALPDPVAYLGQGALAYTALTRDAEVPRRSPADPAGRALAEHRDRNGRCGRGARRAAGGIVMSAAMVALKRSAWCLGSAVAGHGLLALAMIPVTAGFGLAGLWTALTLGGALIFAMQVRGFLRRR
jgi:hypothetical protein